MPKMIQIRNVPDSMHRRLKARAARAGKSLSDYLKDELARSLEGPSVEEWLARVARRSPVRRAPPAAAIVREEREAR